MLSGSENCARTPPAPGRVEPEPSASRSSSTTSRTPLRASWYAVLRPITPPPRTTTDADAGGRRRGGGGRPRPSGEVTARPLDVSPCREEGGGVGEGHPVCLGDGLVDELPVERVQAEAQGRIGLGRTDPPRPPPPPPEGGRGAA